MEAIALGSGDQRVSDCCHDLILRLLGEEWVHGQTDHLARSTLRFGECTELVPKRGEDRLLVKALRIIDGGRDSLFLEFGAQRLTVRDANRILSINMGVTGSNGRARADIPEHLSVPSANPDTRSHLVFEMGHLGQYHGRLKGVEATIHSHHRVVMTFFAAMSPDRTHELREAIIVSEQGAAVTEAT